MKWQYSKLCEKVLKLCEEENATMKDMEKLPREIKNAVEDNQKRFGESKPFRICD